jgi:hypothetical protein
MSHQIDDATKLRFEFYKNISGVTLAAVAGATALINSLLSNAHNKYIAFIAIGCFICSAISIHGAQEVLVNRSSTRPRFSNRITSLLFSPHWHSLEAEYVFSGVSGATLGLGFVLFGFFVVYA